MAELLVTVDNVSKKFCRNLKRSLWYGVKDIASELTGNKNHNDHLRKDEFWAVKDVCFELRRGECLGLIGHNGAGKSTLLKMLNGLIKPNQGTIEMRGRVGALIELGAGFNPILTGRENIYVNGQVLGLTKEEINKKFEAIVEFAEIGEFLDMPVQNYSSGMKVRLGFAVAAQMEPDVLIIDEVLAVGDVGFRAKCLNAINWISQSAAVIFVSHTMPQIARISTTGILMHQGKAKYQGNDISKLIDSYFGTFDEIRGRKSGSMRANLMDVKLSSAANRENDYEMFKIEYLDDLNIEMVFKADHEIKFLNVNLVFYDKEMKGAAQTYSLNSNLRIENTGKEIRTMTTINSLNLNPGIYSISIVISDEKRQETLVNYHAFKSFQVYGDFLGFTAVQYKAKWQLL